jgi:two-component system CheB/CheR fusion protein
MGQRILIGKSNGETLSNYASEVSEREGRRYTLRIRPYCTLDNKIEGAVIALMDMDRRRHDGQTATRAEKVSHPRK